MPRLHSLCPMEHHPTREAGYSRPVKKNGAQSRRAVSGNRGLLVARLKSAARPKPSRGQRADGMSIGLKSGLSSTETDTENSAARILVLERQLVAAPANSRLRREVTKAIRIEAAVYRKSLDAEQTMAIHDPHGLKP